MNIQENPALNTPHYYEFHPFVAHIKVWSIKALGRSDEVLHMYQPMTMTFWSVILWLSLQYQNKTLNSTKICRDFFINLLYVLDMFHFFKF